MEDAVRASSSTLVGRWIRQMVSMSRRSIQQTARSMSQVYGVANEAQPETPLKGC